MSAAQNAVVNDPPIYDGKDLGLTELAINDILKHLGFNIIVREDSVDYQIIKELVNEC